MKILDWKRKKINDNLEASGPTAEEIESYEQDLENLEKRKKELKPPKKSFFFRLFRRRLYKKLIKDYIKKKDDIKNDSEKISSLGAEIDKKKAAAKGIKAELEALDSIDFKASRNKLLKNQALRSDEKYVGSCDKIKTYISDMIKEDPSLVKDAEFMRECVEFDMGLISLDESNDPDVYKTFANVYKNNYLVDENLKAKGYTEADIQQAKANCESLIKELTTPAAVGEGNYKIPHEYIYSRLRKAVLPAAKNFGITDPCKFAIEEYLAFDGKVTEEQGAQLLASAKDEKDYVAFHAINGNQSENKSEREDEGIVEQDEVSIEFDGNEFPVSKNKELKEPDLISDSNYVKTRDAILEHINKMIEEDPSLVKDAKFMSACVKFDFNLISRDESNDPEVYKTFAEEYLNNYLSDENLKAKGCTEADIKQARKYCESLIKELTTPAEVKEGMHKIPHAYIFDRIRKALSSEAETFNVTDPCKFAIEEYLDYDGMLTKEQAKKLYSLFEDRDNYIVFDCISFAGNKKPKDINQYFRARGAALSSDKNLIESALSSRKNMFFGPLGYMKRWTKEDLIIIAKVPKSDVDNGKHVIDYDSKKIRNMCFQNM